MAGEWMYVTADREETTISAARTAKAYGDYQATGGSFFAHYFLTGGPTVPLSAKKGKIGDKGEPGPKGDLGETGDQGEQGR